jgi:acetoin utilization deacetylase AcuC-like enzyme
MENTIAVIDDAVFLEHRAPGGEEALHPERPERLEAARAGLRAAKLTARQLRLPPRDATLDELHRVHSGRYIEALAGIIDKSGYLDADTFFSPLSHRASLRAAGGAVALVDSLLDGHATYGVALVRPPGHHARPGSAMGFCLLNNVAVAAAHARARGAERVAIVDFDVHHGNGTQEIFYEDPTVLYISTHQYPFYPGTGGADEQGAGEGTGATLNVPLSPGADDAVYAAAFDRLVAPVVAEFDPDLLLISAGFDAHVRDPLAAMQVTDEGYGRMTRVLASCLPRGASGRIGLVLEGGYDLTGLETSLRASLEALDAGAKAPETPGKSVPEPFERDLSALLAAARRNHPYL